MKVITTKFIPATKEKGGKIKATDNDGNTIIIPYPHPKESQNPHRDAALSLKKKMGWEGRMYGAITQRGAYWDTASVWVFEDPEMVID